MIIDNNKDGLNKRINELKKEIEKQTFYTQVLSNNYDKIIKLKEKLNILIKKYIEEENKIFNIKEN